MIEPLATQRLVLREFRDGDARAVAAYAMDPEVVRYLQWGPNTYAQCEEFVQRAIEQQSQDPRNHFELAITTADQGLIGAISLHISDPGSGQAWIGYGLRRDSWRQGFATEAARAVVRFAFSGLGLHRVFATCDVRNVASEAVLKRAGLTREGTLREHKRVKNEWRTSHQYSILASDPSWVAW